MIFRAGCEVPMAVLTPNHRVESQAEALALYERHRAATRVLGCDFFEGVVMSRAERDDGRTRPEGAQQWLRSTVRERIPFTRCS